MDIRLKISDLDCDPLERSELTMILTCPNCATRFFVADEAIGPGGRRVECDACHHVWLSNGPQPEVRREVAVERAEASPPTGKEAERTDMMGGSLAPTASPLFAAGTPSQTKAYAKRSARPWVLALLIVGFVLLAGALASQRQIVSAYPGTASVYRAIGLRDADRMGE